MNEPFRYDLLTEPWIACERPDGTRVLLGIERALLEAHELAAVHDESPLVTATLHRLLLAILQRVFAPGKMEDWVALWEAPAFDAERIRSYLAEWQHSFDLFHSERPFLQVANLREVLVQERKKEPEATPVWRLALESSAHSNCTQLFEPLPPAPALSPAASARALLGFLAFTSGGRIQNEADSWEAGSLRGGAVMILRDETLRRTLLLNLLRRQERPGDDLPPWESNESPSRQTRAPFGEIDQLLWQSRRVQLVPCREAGEAAVREVITAAGAQFDVDHPDAMFAYTERDPKKPPMAIRIDRERGVWRDAAALFEITGDRDRPPRAVVQVAEVVREGVVPRDARLRLDVFGLSSEKGKPAAVRLWRSDRLPLPLALLADRERVDRLRSALAGAEELGERLKRRVLWTLAATALAPGDREADAKDIGRLIETLGAMPAYWAGLGHAFSRWLEELGATENIDEALASWKHTVRETAEKVVAGAELRLGTGARALQAGAKARRALRLALAELLGPRPSRDEARAASTPKTTGAPT